MSIHPADFAAMTPAERMTAAYRGDFDGRIHWKVQRVAELTGLDPEVLHEHVEVGRGWEPHDDGYLRQVIVSARILLGLRCSNCGDDIPTADAPSGLVATGGWCMPSETLYAMPEPDPLCSDCKARLLMVMEVGIDPGRHGENLRMPRGGIQYGATSG